MRGREVPTLRNTTDTGRDVLNAIQRVSYRCGKHCRLGVKIPELLSRFGVVGSQYLARPIPHEDEITPRCQHAARREREVKRIAFPHDLACDRIPGLQPANDPLAVIRKELARLDLD